MKTQTATEFLKERNCLSYKGDIYLDTGYFYCPYLPLTSTPIVNIKKLRDQEDKYRKEISRSLLISDFIFGDN